MRAVLSKAPGGPETLVVEEIPDPTPGAGQVVIEVKAVGINFPDTLIIEDKYQFRPERPFAPGAEVAGVVEAIGEGVKGIHKGDRVIAVPGWGGLVERIAVPAASVIPIPKEMDFETAAAHPDRPYGDRPHGDRPHGDRFRGERRPGERHHGDRHHGDRRQAIIDTAEDAVPVVGLGDHVPAFLLRPARSAKG